MRRKLEKDKIRDLGLKRKQFFMEMLAWNFKYCKSFKRRKNEHVLFLLNVFAFEN